ncbi:MAG: hypothetical protein JXA54_14455 [Candidatus Heimdallarchaeota archaeon]|nr:hypothetical protein [Candidatus Heimdallarchaeota archaeon]
MAGVSETSNVYTNPPSDYRFTFSANNEDWLKNSVLPRINDKITTKNNEGYKITTGKDGYPQIRGGNKGLVRNLMNFCNKPDEINKLPKEQKNEWLRGYLDKNLTAGLKREIGSSRATDNNPDRLKLARDLLRPFGVKATLHPKDSKIGSHLKISDYKSHSNLLTKVGLENKNTVDRIKGSIENPKIFAKPENQKFNELGHRLQDIMKSVIDYYRPNTTPHTLKDDKNALGKSMKPDYIRANPQGKVEAIDVKLRDTNDKPKDKLYNTNREISKTTMAYWEGSGRPTKEVNGKPFRYESLKEFRDKLKDYKKEAKTKEEKNKLTKALRAFRKFERDFKREEKKANRRGRRSEFGRNSPRSEDKTKPSDGNANKDRPHDSKGNKDSGKENNKQEKPTNNQEKSNNSKESKETNSNEKQTN